MKRKMLGAACAAMAAAALATPSPASAQVDVTLGTLPCGSVLECVYDVWDPRRMIHTVRDAVDRTVDDACNMILPGCALP